MVTFLKKLITALVLLGTSAWGSYAVYLGDSHTSIIQICIAAVFALLGLATLITEILSRRYHWLVLGYLIMFAGILVWWLFAVTPSNDRQWQTDVARLPYATIDNDYVTVHNIRNFDYKTETDYKPGYYTKTYDLNALEGVDLIAVYWMGPAIAHTIMSFNFGNHDHLAISIEARKELSEGYSTINGFFRQYELIYIVADERDVVRLRTNYRKDPPEDAYLYRIHGPKQNAKRLFLEYIRKINELNEKPNFYNTMVDNCTTAIWFNTRINPEHLPFSWKILLSGYVPEYLYESKRTDVQVPFSELQRQAHINKLAQAADQSPDFSQLIRVNIEKSMLHTK